MRDCKHGSIRRVGVAAAVMILLIAGTIAEGHAVLKTSSPAANATVQGPDVPVTLQFNVRVDAKRSKLQLLHPDSSVTDLPLDNQDQAPPDTLKAKATGLTPGNYQIQWQVLAPDGHITRGIVPFTVKAS